MQEAVTYVISTYTGSTAWAPHDSILCGHGDKKQYMGCDVDVNKGAEASAYLLFILRNWENLPQKIAFLDGHERSWHAKFNMLERIDRCKRLSLRYIGLNMCRIDTATNPTWSRASFAPVWNAVVRPHVHLPCPHRIVADGSGQFMVTRQAIKHWPKELYADLYKYVVGSKHWPGDSRWQDAVGFTYSPGGDDSFVGGVFFLEWIWSYLFSLTTNYEIELC